MLNKNQLIILRVRYITSLSEEEFEDTEGVIRLGKSRRHTSLYPIFVAQSLIFCVLFCGSLYFFSSLFLWALYCLSLLH